MLKGIKSRLLNHCIDFIEEKRQTLQSEYKIYQDSAANETKSTAGDKHDTSKSMMQLEQEKLGQQLKIVLQQKKTLESIDVNRECKCVEFGCVVETNSGNFFLAISVKEILLDDQLYVPVSIQSPLAKALNNKTVGDRVMFNDKTYIINSII
jgi:transcription elongation GreA/GreB family factor